MRKGSLLLLLFAISLPGLAQPGSEQGKKQGGCPKLFRGSAQPGATRQVRGISF